MNITRPQNHVSVPPSLEINLVLTFYSEIRLCLMVPCHSIMTALYTLESLSLPTELSRALTSIRLLQITNKDSTIYMLVAMGSGVSRILSLSFCQRFVYFPLWLLAVERCFYAEHASFGDQRIQTLLFCDVWIQEWVRKHYQLRDVLPRYCRCAEVEGRRFMLVFIRFWNDKILLI